MSLQEFAMTETCLKGHCPFDFIFLRIAAQLFNKDQFDFAEKLGAVFTKDLIFNSDILNAELTENM